MESIVYLLQAIQLTGPRTSCPENGKGSGCDTAANSGKDIPGDSPFALVSTGAHSRQADGADRRRVGDGGGYGRRLGQDELTLPDEAGGHQTALAAVAEGLRSKKCSLG